MNLIIARVQKGSVLKSGSLITFFQASVLKNSPFTPFGYIDILFKTLFYKSQPNIFRTILFCFSFLITNVFPCVRVNTDQHRVIPVCACGSNDLPTN